MIPAPENLPWNPNRVSRVVWSVRAHPKDLMWLEGMVPGTKVWTQVAGCNPLYTAKRVLEEGMEPAGLPLVVASATCWWLTKAAIESRYSISAPVVAPSAITPYPVGDEAALLRMVDRGKELWQELQLAGLIHRREDFTPTAYQYRNLAWSSDRRANLMIWPPGSGKTKAAMSSLLLKAHMGRMSKLLAIGPGRARPAWARQVPELSTVVPFRHIPPSKHNVGVCTLAEYRRLIQAGCRPPRVRASWRRVAIIGSRGWGDTAAVVDLVDRLPAGCEVVSGGARGPDKVAVRAAQQRGLPVRVLLPDDDKYGFTRARLLRNVDIMATHPDCVIAYWDGESSGTAHALSVAKRMGLNVQVVSPGQVPAIEFFIYGLESLAQFKPEVISLGAEAIAMDEIHRMGSKERWKSSEGQDGKTKFDRRKTKRSGTDKLAVALEDTVKAPSVRFRLGMTATPMGRGKPRRCFAQFDLLIPGCMGAFRDYAGRYCVDDNAPLTFMGWPSDEGSSHVEELHHRTLFFRHEVDHAESHGELPPVRVEYTLLTAEDQSKVGSFKAEISSWTKLAAKHRDGDIDLDALPPSLRARVDQSDAWDRDGDTINTGALLREAQNAQATSVKYAYVVERTMSMLTQGGKVVVFVNRRDMCEKWAAQLASEIRRRQQADRAGEDAVVVWGHGGVPEREREEAVNTFRDHEGAVLLVGTAQAFGESVDGLQVASYMALASMPGSIEELIQQKGRLSRLGGIASLIEVIIAEGTCDDRTAARLANQVETVREFRTASELEGVIEGLMGWDVDVLGAEMGERLASRAEVVSLDGSMFED